MRPLAVLETLARDERGQALVETVVIAPLLVLVLLGLIEVGRYGDFTIKVANAARAGAQYGARGDIYAGDNAGIQSAALTDAQNVSGLTISPTTVCQCIDGTSVSCTDGAACSTSRRIAWVQVTATGTMNSLLNYPGIPSSLQTINVSSKATMRVAQ